MLIVFYIKEFLIIDDWYDGRRYWTLEIGRATGRFASSFWDWPNMLQNWSPESVPEGLETNLKLYPQAMKSGNGSCIYRWLSHGKSPFSSGISQLAMAFGQVWGSERQATGVWAPDWGLEDVEHRVPVEVSTGPHDRPWPIKSQMMGNLMIEPPCTLWYSNMASWTIPELNGGFIRWDKYGQIIYK